MKSIHKNWFGKIHSHADHLQNTQTRHNIIGEVEKNRTYWSRQQMLIHADRRSLSLWANQIHPQAVERSTGGTRWGVNLDLKPKTGIHHARQLVHQWSRMSEKETRLKIRSIHSQSERIPYLCPSTSRRWVENRWNFNLNDPFIAPNWLLKTNINFQSITVQ